MSTLGVVTAVALRTWSKVVRRPVVLTFSFVQPLMWMLFFGFLFQRYPLELFSVGVSYVTFLAPGVAAMTVLFGASQAGIALIRDHQTGFLARMLGTPAGAGAQLAGKLGADVVRLLLQAAVVLGLGVAVGAELTVEPASAAMAFTTLGLFAFAFSAVSCAVALVARAPEPMSTFIHVVNMPLLFTSTALVPARQMPDWLQGVVRWNPLTLTVDTLRDALLFGIVPRPEALVMVLLLAVGLFVIASALLRRAERG